MAYSEKYLVAYSHPYFKPLTPSANRIPKRTLAKALPCKAAESSN